jgi:co-chaperonin GroES (HSP10)
MMSFNITPEAEYIVAKVVKADNKTASGLYVVDSAVKEFPYVTVVSVGKDVKNRKAGDKVIYQDDYKIKRLVVDKEEYVILKNEDIIATVK